MIRTRDLDDLSCTRCAALLAGARSTGRFEEVIKCLNWDNITFRVSRILISVDEFITHTFFLLYVHVSFDAAFVGLRLLY